MLAPAPERKVLSGEVINKNANNTYNVSIGGRILIVRSTDTAIKKGTRVVINKADEGYYIITTEKRRTRNLQTVIVNG